MARRYFSATGRCSWENPSQQCCTESSESTLETHQSKYYLRDSDGHPSFGGAVFRLHCLLHTLMHNPTSPLNQCLFPFAQSLSSYNLRKPGSWFSQEYALLTTCIPSSITQLSFGILFHTHCSRYPIMLNSTKPYLITGKNTNTNLSSICNTHDSPPPPPPPVLTTVRFSSVPYYWKPPRSGTPTLLGNPQILIIQSTNINNTIHKY